MNFYSSGSAGSVKLLWATIGLSLVAGCAPVRPGTPSVPGPGIPAPMITPWPPCPANRACVDVVMVDMGGGVKCPVATKYNTTLNASAQISKSGVKKIRWRAVDALGNQETGVTFSVFFDPFVGKAYQSTGGTVDSNNIKSSPADKVPPSNVDYKYTVTADGCNPLDPVIRVNN